MLNILHDTHPGIVKIKSLARSYVWWPKMDTNSEEKVKCCATCQSHQKTPPCSSLHPCEWPGRPLSRVHVDYAGPSMGKMFLLIINAHSKWMDIHCVNSATFSVTMDKMRSTFASHALPEIVVSYNKYNFMSSEFKSFLQKKKASSTLPQHLTTQVQMVWWSERRRPLSKGLRKRVTVPLTPSWLLSYRITLQSTTGEPPAKLRWGRSLKSHLDLLRPDVATRVHLAHSRQKKQHDQHSRTHGVKLGDAVSVRTASGGRSGSLKLSCRKPALFLRESN